MAETNIILQGGKKEIDLLLKADAYFNSFTPKSWEIKENNTTELILRHGENFSLPKKEKFYSQEKNKWIEPTYSIEELITALEKNDKERKYVDLSKEQDFISAYENYKKGKNMELTAQEIFNEIQEKFNPKEKAYLELKILNNIGGYHNMDMVDVGNHLNSEEIKNVHQYISALYEKYSNPIRDSEGWLVDENYDKLLGKIVYIMETNDDFLKDVNPVYLEVNQNIQKRTEQNKENNMDELELNFFVRDFIKNQINEDYENIKSFKRGRVEYVVLESNERVNYNSEEFIGLQRLGDNERLWSVEKQGTNQIALALKEDFLSMYENYKKGKKDASLEEQRAETYNLIGFINGGKLYSSAQEGNKDITPTKEELIKEFLNLTDYQKEFVKEQGAKTAISLIEEVIEDSVSKEREIDIYKNFEEFFKSVEQYQKNTTDLKKSNITEYLNNQMKYLGLGDNHTEEIQKGIDSAEKSFQIYTTSDKVMKGNKVDFAVNFNKSEKGGVFLNSFDAKLITAQGEERTNNFRLNFTAKEAINLLEGRAVKTELTNKQGEKFEALVKLNFAEEKNEYGNYKFQTFTKNYGVDTAQIVDKSGLKFDKPEYKENTIKSLEKGNIVKVKFEHDGKEIEGKAVLNPQYKTLNLYDKDMNRLNTNKPLQGLEQDNSHEKNNVRQQSISRSH